MKGPNRNNINEFPSKLLDSQSLFSALNKTVYHVHQNNTWVIWHRRLGHSSTRILSCMLKSFELDWSLSIRNFNCNSCLCSKSSKVPFKVSSISSSKPVEVIYSDVWESPNLQSNNGFCYYVVFLDHFTRFARLFPMKYKLEVVTIFKQFKEQVERVGHSN